MQCSNCGFENPEEMKFCGQCGQTLGRDCPECGFENPPNFKFCGNCGTNLSQPAPSRPSTRVKHPPNRKSIRPELSEAERRHLTVMFVDLVGSTSLSQQLDPEELRKLVGAYQETCVAAISRYEGHVAQYLGDGLLVYFGYPLAHEDDAQRAIRTGLEIIKAIKRLNDRLQYEMDRSLALRVGIHTGLVVVGQMGAGHKHERLAVGDTPNIAARLQNLAKPNTIVISANTFRLVQGFFETQSLGQKSLRGIDQPIEVYEVLSEYEVRNRIEAAGGTGLTPLVGREQELGLTLARWEQVLEGKGQIVCLSGEAGIGKSRLVQDFKNRLGQADYSCLECFGSAYHKNSALHPLIGLLRQVIDLHRDDSDQEKLGKLEAVLIRRATRSSQDDTLAEAVPLLAPLLAIPVGEQYSSSTLSPQRKKQRTLEILLAMLLDLATEQPVLFVVEDLHWVDPSTLEFLNLLIDQGSTSSILALFTFRPSFTPTWASRSHITHLNLNRLTRRQIKEMVERVTGGKTIPSILLQEMVSKTDGVPLFVEELTKMVLELNLLKEMDDHYELEGVLSSLAIPTTLHDSLMARLDRLATVKEVAQLAATIGREFSYELLQAVSEREESLLRRDLKRLIEAELLYQRGIPPQATYLFKHALIQETAYRSLLRSRRQQYHQQIAQVLIELFPETVELQPELLAHHYMAAGLNQEAITYWKQAGQRAIERSAHVEAIRHLNKGLELLGSLPDTSENTQRKLDFQITLGVPLLMTRGYASQEVERAYARAWQLSQQIGETPQLISALFGLWVFYLVRADYEMASRLGDQLMPLAQRFQDPIFLLEAHQAQGINFFYQGELITAREHLEQAIALYDPEERNTHASYSGADPGVACLCHLALTLWLLGYPDQATEQIAAALNLAKKLAHPFSQAFTLSLSAWLHQYLREGPKSQKLAEATIKWSTEQGFALLLGFGTILKGWALAEQDQAEAGMVQIRQGLETYHATGAELGRLHFLALLAEANGRGAQIEAGLHVLDEAIETASQNGERFYEAELYRLKGTLLLKQPQNGSEAENYFQRSIEVARHQQAKSLELRAAMSLSRLWQQQQKTTQAKQLLTDIYNWFNEGFETADLKEAQKLLASF